MYAPKWVSLPTRPEEIQVDLGRAAVVCVDMQNAFLKKGGLFDAGGVPMEGAANIIPPTRRIIEAARAAKMKVVYLTMSFRPALTNAGCSQSPVHHKEVTIKLMRSHPDIQDGSIIQDTWGEQVIDELKPRLDEPVVRKSHYSGFMGTDLDVILRTLDVTCCIFVGEFTNVCVLHTLMDAYSRDYTPIVVEDSVFSPSPQPVIEATMWNVENFFGWVVREADLRKVLERAV